MNNTNEALFDNQPIKWSPEVEEYLRRATRTWCYRLGVKGEDVKDLEQDAVMVAWDRILNSKVRYREGLWFIARNVVLDFRAKSNRIFSTELDEDIVRLEQEPLNSIIIENLERDFPELIMLAKARDDGFEWELIAESLGVTCGTLRVRYSRMVKKAASFFGEEVWDILRL